MKSVQFSLAKFCKFIGFQSASLVEGVSTGICSFAAFGSLFVLDGWLKLAGFVGFFILAYLIAWLMDVLKGEA
ncbi:putative membrane protein [Enterobacter cloacae S611]|uniref:Membrane protein n=1 Tax=Enterobacter cloacae S611 TaxID=1399146 RepID=A0ABP2ZMA3_ENTCL|nr:putative membrane protein [Enterobacter cloacae S611]